MFNAANGGSEPKMINAAAAEFCQYRAGRSHSLRVRYDRAASVGADIHVTLKLGFSLHRRKAAKSQMLRRDQTGAMR